ncbi:hypothetical protein [Parafrankia soli]|uniref:hypothetical protein n=1 Tax=Parafrankia soli TaxID=2599596 RepID=UPI001041FCCC|nr:hypothetical protein [Parafrankia soli]
MVAPVARARVSPDDRSQVAPVARPGAEATPVMAPAAPSGARYQPLSRALVVAPQPGGELRLPARAGETVYAVAGGVVDGRSPLLLRADDGRSYRYQGTRCLPQAGTRVAAGEPIGVVVPHLHDGDPDATCLHLAVTGPDGDVLDAYGLVAGLPDPAEPGWWVTGYGVDPDLALVPRRQPAGRARRFGAPPAPVSSPVVPMPPPASASASAPPAAVGLGAGGERAGGDGGEDLAALAALLVTDQVRPADRADLGGAG